MVKLNFFNRSLNFLWLDGECFKVQTKYVPEIGTFSWIELEPITTELTPPMNYDVDVQWVEDGNSVQLIDEEGHVWLEVGCREVKKDTFRSIIKWEVGWK